MIKILYYEDEPALAKIVKESLISRGFEVTHYHQSEDVSKELNMAQPNICLVDVMLPKKDGFQIGREIKHQNPSLPIIFITAKDQTVDVLEGFKIGANDYIKKPFSLEELIVRIQNIYQITGNSQKENNSKATTFGGYTFNENTYDLIHVQGTRKLSHREAQLLALFLQSNGNIVTRKYILDTLWGDDHFFNSRNLDVYITKMRQYLKYDDKIELITLKAVGYKLVY